MQSKMIAFYASGLFYKEKTDTLKRNDKYMQKIWCQHLEKKKSGKKHCGLPNAWSFPEWKSFKRLRRPLSISWTSETSVRKECCIGVDWAPLPSPPWGLAFSFVTLLKGCNKKINCIWLSLFFSGCSRFSKISELNGISIKMRHKDKNNTK